MWFFYSVDFLHCGKLNMPMRKAVLTTEVKLKTRNSNRMQDT